MSTRRTLDINGHCCDYERCSATYVVREATETWPAVIDRCLFGPEHDGEHHGSRCSRWRIATRRGLDLPAERSLACTVADVDLASREIVPAKEAEMDSLVEWRVDRTTTEKLAQILNELVEMGRKIELTQYIGGRDWVVLSTRKI